MPLVFRAAFKPTPSIAKAQQTIDLRMMREAKEDSITLSFENVAQIFQFVCLMKQAKDLMTWGE